MSHVFGENRGPSRYRSAPMSDPHHPTWLDTPLGAAVLELEARVLADALAIGNAS